MGDRCQLHLQRYEYNPGDVIHGKVDCYFSQEQKVTNIKVRFKGRAKVYWVQGKTHHRANEDYFNMESNLLLCETNFTPGTYVYPFSFTLPINLPSSLGHKEGNIKYTVKAVVDKPWAVDYEHKREFFICDVVNLNLINGLNKPYVFVEHKTPTPLFTTDGDAISVWVQLPKTGFVPNEMVTFQARIKNNSSCAVKEVLFRLEYGFELITPYRRKTLIIEKGPHFGILDGTVASNSEKCWDLELRVPPSVYCRSLQACQIINSFCELQGKVCLPFLHRNIKFKIPLVIGMVPLEDV